MFKLFKNKFNKDPKLKYKKKSIPYYGSKIDQINIYGKNTLKKYNWNYDIIVPWRYKFLKPTKDWLDIEIARDKIFLHPLSLKAKHIVFTLRKRWKKLPQKIHREPWFNDTNHFINSLHNTNPYLKYIHPSISKKLKFKKKFVFFSKKTQIKKNNNNLLFEHILLHYKFIPKFNQLEKTATTKILSRYNLKHNRIKLLNPCFLNWKLINIYDIQYGTFKYVKIHPEWKFSYPSSQMIITKKLNFNCNCCVSIYLSNYIFSKKLIINYKNNEKNITNWNESYNISCRYFNHYSPVWESIKVNHIIKSKNYHWIKGGEWYVLNNKPRVKPRNKKTHIKFPVEFYLGKSFYGTYKEIDSMLNLLKKYPEYTGKVLKNIRDSECLEYVKKDYYKYIFLNIKPMYTSLWQHYY